MTYWQTLKLLSLVVLKFPYPFTTYPRSADRFLVHRTRFSQNHVWISTLATTFFYIPTYTNFSLNRWFGAPNSEFVLKVVPESPLAFRIVTELQQSCRWYVNQGFVQYRAGTTVVRYLQVIEVFDAARCKVAERATPLCWHTDVPRLPLPSCCLSATVSIESFVWRGRLCHFWRVTLHLCTRPALIFMRLLSRYKILSAWTVLMTQRWVQEFRIVHMIID